MQPVSPPPPPPLGEVVVQAPKDFVTWSSFSSAFLNYCCLGFAALFFSIKSRDCKVMGDPEGAAMHGRKAKYLNIIALILGIVIFIIVSLYLASALPFFDRALKGILQRYKE